MIATKRSTVSKTRLQAGDFVQIEFRNGEAPQLRFFRPNNDGSLLADNEGEKTLLPRPSEGISNAAHVITIFFIIASACGLATSKLDRAAIDGGEIFKVEMLES